MPSSLRHLTNLCHIDKLSYSLNTFSRILPTFPSLYRGKCEDVCYILLPFPVERHIWIMYKYIVWKLHTHTHTHSHTFLLYSKALNLKYVSFLHFARQYNNIKAPAIWIYNSFISYSCVQFTFNFTDSVPNKICWYWKS